ncbi:S8 family peptidase [Paenibacillus sp. 1P07SE]|uniref:S8 family peptidase n=1 Tax=Paenibacillus sp. 1P07SE TaxID=3132209 RepID=UPI0039A6147B
MTHIGHILCRCARSRPTAHTARHLIVFRKETDCKACHAYLVRRGMRAVKHVQGASMLCCHLDKRISWRSLQAHPAIRYIEEDRKARAHAARSPIRGTVVTRRGSGPLIPWNIRQVQAPRVWPLTRGRGVRLAILDTGIAKHPDLRIAGGVDTTGARSYNDDNGHGTHVAGIAAALGRSGQQAGVAPQAELYAVKVLDAYGFGFVSDIVEGIDWCIRNRMQVMNMSFGLEPGVRSRALHEAIRRAARRGIVMAASAGNAGARAAGLDAPAHYAAPLAVAASTRSERIAALSSRGAGIGVTAPGQDIRSTWPGGGYKILSGTSMATPHVAGAAALLLSARPQLTSANVRRLLERSARPLPGTPRRAQGHGLLQAAAALHRMSACRRTSPAAAPSALRRKATAAAP